MARKRLPMIIGGLLAAGAAAGVVASMVSRRRQQRWHEYGSSQPTGSTSTSSRNEGKSMADFAKAGMEAGIAKVTESVKEKVADLGAGTSSGSVTSSSPIVASSTPIEFGQTTDAFTRAGTGSTRNSRS